MFAMDSNLAKVDCCFCFNNRVWWRWPLVKLLVVIITRGHQNLPVVVGVNQGRFSYNKLSKTAIIRII